MLPNKKVYVETHRIRPDDVESLDKRRLISQCRTAIAATILATRKIVYTSRAPLRAGEDPLYFRYDQSGFVPKPLLLNASAQLNRQRAESS